jgi:hypothetical protein
MRDKPVGELEPIIIEAIEKGKGSCSLHDVLDAARGRGWHDTDTKSKVQMLIAFRRLRTTVDLKLELVRQERIILRATA